MTPRAARAKRHKKGAFVFVPAPERVGYVPWWVAALASIGGLALMAAWGYAVYLTPWAFFGPLTVTLLAAFYMGIRS